MKDEDGMKSYKTIIIVFIVAIFIVIVIGLYIWNFHEEPVSKFTSDWGSFGDYLSGTLFTPITVFLVWLTYTSQSKELREQRKFTQQQLFEQTFFLLLRSIKESSSQEKTDTAFNDYSAAMKGRIDQRNNYYYSTNGECNEQEDEYNLDKTVRASGNVYKQIEPNHKWINGYMTLVFEAIKYIDQGPPQFQKQIYYSILKSHLSDKELVLIGAASLAEIDKSIYIIIKESSMIERESTDSNINLLLTLIKETDIDVPQ